MEARKTGRWCSGSVLSLMRTAMWLGALALVLALAASCATVDYGMVQAQEVAPPAAQVPILAVPYDPNLPRFVVAVEPFQYAAQGLTSGAGAPTSPQPTGTIPSIVTGGLQGSSVEGRPIQHQEPTDRVGPGIAEQFKTALSQCGNVSIIDISALIKNPDGTYSCRLNPGEVGPFIIRGTVTEFNETADLADKSRGGSLGGLGAVLGAAGAIADKPGLMWTGTGIAAANPTYQYQKMTRRGMVGLDLQLTDGRTARMVRGYNAAGSFATQSATSGVSLFGIGGGDAKFAASALGQATRAAMNDAVRKTVESLRVAPR
ncbi:hypothetical protein FJY63_04120 [Candidatus Sumerlaeota bacterium]|nr:hypothetical protein [Candidatus Sumerlaeota bacterium]